MAGLSEQFSTCRGKYFGVKKRKHAQSDFANHGEKSLLTQGMTSLSLITTGNKKNIDSLNKVKFDDVFGQMSKTLTMISEIVWNTFVSSVRMRKALSSYDEQDVRLGSSGRSNQGQTKY